MSMCLYVLSFLVSFTFVVSEKESFLTCKKNCDKCNCCKYKYDGLTPLSVNINCDVSSVGTIIQPDNTSQDGNFKLFIYNSCLSVIPDNICEFPALQVLILQRNNIKEVPNLSCLKELVYLDLSYNKIEILRTGILESLKMLRYLRLSRNQIAKIQPGVFHTGLDNIKYVYLDNNKLTEFDLWALNITHRFCVFSLENNEITRAVNEVSFKIKLSGIYGPGFLSLRYNNMAYWPELLLGEIGFKDIRMIGMLMSWGFDLRDNPWHCDCKMYSFVSLVYNFAEVIQRDYMEVICNAPSHLEGRLIRDVQLSDLVCDIISLCPTNCLCQEQPALSRFLIDCRNSGLMEMPIELPGHRNLFLLFQNNSIEFLQDRPYFKRTIYLDISNNNLFSISSEAVDNLIGLNYLNLENNKLKYLPENIQNLRKTEINICNNNLICSCSDIWLFQWFDTKPNIKDIPNITCSLSRDQSDFIFNINKNILNCENNVQSKVISIVLGMLAFAGLVFITCCIYHKYELLTIYYSIISPIFRNKVEIQPKPNITDVFISCNENDDNDRMWVGNNLIPFIAETRLTSYISFRDGLPGDVTVDTNIKTIHNSDTVIAVISESYVTDQSMMFELNEVYHHMIKKRNGRLIIIKRGDFQPSLINNRYIRSLFKLDKFIESDDVYVFDKILRKLPKRQFNNYFEL